MTRQLFFFVVFFFSLPFCWAQNNATFQYIEHETLGRNLKNHTLIDTTTGIKYTLDSTQIYITATDADGTQLWRTDPWKDNKLEAYRVERPYIIIFDFTSNKFTYGIEVIWIIYNNTQFGIVDKRSGKFTFYGQN